jgi:hypothetical protein
MSTPADPPSTPSQNVVDTSQPKKILGLSPKMMIMVGVILIIVIFLVVNYFDVIKDDAEKEISQNNLVPAEMYKIIGEAISKGSTTCKTAKDLDTLKTCINSLGYTEYINIIKMLKENNTTECNVLNITSKPKDRENNVKKCIASLIKSPKVKKQNQGKGTKKCYIPGTDETVIKNDLFNYGIDNVTLKPLCTAGYEITDFRWIPAFEFGYDSGGDLKIPTALIDSTNPSGVAGNKAWKQFQDKKPSISKNLTCDQEKYTIKYNDKTSVVIDDSLAEGFENYVPQPIKEVFDWIAGRPDINEKSKLSLLPGFEF